jgi:AAHS family benzoate transporter-like MFS transporter
MGWAIGIGRLGAIVSPLIGGMLLVWGFSAGQSMLVFALPLLLAALAIFNIHSEPPLNE